MPGGGCCACYSAVIWTNPQKPLNISYSEYDKPFLASSDLRFNLAHSGGLALYAFSLHSDIGVDVERERDLSDALAISERFFSPAEREVLRRLTAGGANPGFLPLLVAQGGVHQGRWGRAVLPPGRL